ncbi:transcriptional regulator [Sinorhizobium medicae]|uniref:helix-turn-helix transcriptional regulator n=1 Tax=Sinorhizobium TaxID=28105 RepID=UPI00036DB344|nr:MULTISPECIES: helix-turn-helix transcriptional regulator [Sinorhizobium]PLU08444.1 transcriptional regulator [Sinorhizobium medicae]PLU16187.1 transcriptional regulator [Sinorhizobium medicae]PLU20199.1 transcriptional regulator [Sinorhizobium medicae]PLU30912.1 transcriptional regulator [Sinorhizobium medicae]PLU74599.1 transcriptional regulator [Sinorhizobium medicae]
METLAEAIKAWRHRADISAREAAEKLGMSRRTLEHIEQGRPYKNETILRLAIERLEATDGETK